MPLLCPQMWAVSAGGATAAYTDALSSFRFRASVVFRVFQIFI